MPWNPFSTSPTRSSYSTSSRRARSTASSHRAPTSRYTRSPRTGYLQSLYRKLRALWRDLVAYARRHPYKVFFAVVMPLVSGGVLTKVARGMGVELPDLGGGARGGGASYSGGYGGGGSQGGYYGSQGYGPPPSRGGEGVFGGLDVQSVAGGIGSLASLAQMASKFM
ncbi:hypothetical protein C7974DRAFT_418374 [Boeremia exigua]|uniref:uncharacterized protein n=1 Tax=Boeremia exigua TaxID=749465 RepID=UPI001E8CCFFC|nr:uncharacterized protein C7974DRAFT_418374 [Boeremia exigua]KAH6612427.1 hypothetical protein C7974DRAFT_418374 [Boeremia exigua]